MTVDEMSPAEYKQAVAPFADALAKIPGLRWKIWLIDEETREAGGTYLFEDERSLRAFLEGPIVTQSLAGNPAFSRLSVRHFDVFGEPTATTRGPVKALAQR